MVQELSLLGGAVLGDRASGVPLPGDRRGWLLAYLASDGGWVDRDRLAVLFWPEANEGGAKRNLRQLLLRVRRLELEPPLETTAKAVRWAVPTDVQRFRAAIAAGRHVEAATIYHGPLLAGLPHDGVGGVAAWLESQRDGLHTAYHRAAVEAAAEAGAVGRHDEAAGWLARLLQLDPLAEDVVQAHMRALALAGRREAAMAVFRRFTTELAAELGLDPLPDTVELADRVAAGALVAQRAALPPRTLGPSRLVPARLVAREAERAAVRGADAPVVLVAGESGIGKSRLLTEAVGDACRCGASDGLERVPYHPFAALLRARPQLAAEAGPYRVDLARLVPEVAPDLDPGPADPATSALRLAEALARAVASSARALVVDDLQWADAWTIDAIVYLAGRGVRVYGAYRTGEESEALLAALAALRSRALVSVIELQGLDERGIATLLADLMDRPRGPPVFARWLHQRSGGNPMFALETLRALFDGGILRADGSAWSTSVDDITRDYGELEVPGAVAEVIERRSRRLSLPTLRVLEAAAAMGSGFDRRVLARVTGLSSTAVADCLVEAEQAGFTIDDAFRHDLLREALDRATPAPRRRAVHGRLVRALGSRADPAVLAEHAFRAGDLPRARTAWLQQARSLRERGLQPEAVDVLRGALERAGDGVDAAWIRLALADGERELDRPDAAEEHLDAVQATAQHDPHLRYAASLARANLLLHRGRAGEARALLAECRGLASLVDDERLWFDDHMLRARAAFELGDAAEAEALLAPAVERLRRGRGDLRLVQFLSSLAVVCGQLHGAEAVLPLHREALALARTLGARYHQVDATINLMHGLADVGRFDEAAALGEEALGLGPYDNLPILRNNLASMHFEAGRIEQALHHFEALTAEQQPYVRVIALARCAEANARLGRRSPVAGYLDRALEEAAHTDYPVALGRLAVAMVAHGDDDQLRRFRMRTAALELDSLPPYLRGEYERALASREPTSVPEGGGMTAA